MGKRGVAEFNQFNSSYPINYGFIALPNDIDREKYIKTCYRRERVSVCVERGGGLINDCYISKNLLKYIDFPEDSTSTGTYVVLAFINNVNHPVIIAALSNESETQLLSDGVYKIGKSVEEKLSFITCDGNQGSLLLNTNGKGITLTASGEGSKILLQSLGQMLLVSSGAFQLNVNNTINIKSQSFEDEKETNINLTSESFGIVDSNNNSISSSGEEINITPKSKLTLFGGSEAMVKGDILQQQLNQNNTYLTQLQTAITTALATIDALGVPASTTFNTAMASAVKGNYSNIKSQKSFTD